VKVKINTILQLSSSIILFTLFVIFTNGFESFLQINDFELTDNPKLQNSKFLKSFHFQKIVDVEKDLIFNLIYNINDYSMVSPEKILNVEITNEKDFFKLSIMTFHVFGINLPTQITHEIIGDSTQIITILDGPAKDSKIILNFSEIDFNTKIDANIFLKFEKPLSLLTINMTENDFREIFNKIIESFINYAQT
jgi:hypothetical protein